MNAIGVGVQIICTCIISFSDRKTEPCQIAMDVGAISAMSAMRVHSVCTASMDMTGMRRLRALHNDPGRPCMAQEQSFGRYSANHMYMMTKRLKTPQKGAAMVSYTCCYKCSDRKPACHDTCERYQAVKAERADAMRKKRAFNDLESAVVEAKQRLWIKEWRNHRR